MASEAVRAWATNLGFVMARHVFKKRGNDVIKKVETALARTSAQIDEMAERWAREHMPCCPSCAFGARYSSLCDKAERQAAWLVNLLRRRGSPNDERRISQLTCDYKEAKRMVEHLAELDQRKKMSRRTSPESGA